MQFSVWKMFKNSGAMHSLVNTIKNMLLDSAKKPANKGIVAFFFFDDPLEKADAEKLVREVKVCVLELWRRPNPLRVGAAGSRVTRSAHVQSAITEFTAGKSSMLLLCARSSYARSVVNKVTADERALSKRLAYSVLRQTRTVPRGRRNSATRTEAPRARVHTQRRQYL
jgi:hypothetical protein